MPAPKSPISRKTGTPPMSFARKGTAKRTPTIGPALTRDYLKEEYGEGCLTFDLGPFLIVYEYDDGSNVAALYDIIRQRLVR